MTGPRSVRIVCVFAAALLAGAALAGAASAEVETGTAGMRYHCIGG